MEKIGISKDTAISYGDKDAFCKLTLAFAEGYADDFTLKEGLVVWGDIDNALRLRVLTGEALESDAFRLLRHYEPNTYLGEDNQLVVNEAVQESK
ncbi:hypothetical protein D3C71_1670350 [compost metagenome]